MKSKNSEILQITELKIKLSDSKEITLTSDEARKVYEELKKLFDFETDFEKIQKEYDKLNPTPHYIPCPIYIDRYIKEPYWTYPIITCENLTSLGNTKGTYAENTSLLINLT